ncbi:MAG: ZIP family metal transporter [Burkholderiales bacterium]|nr:ZIP family metal transporter [Burkholderiales bacterium]
MWILGGTLAGGVLSLLLAGALSYTLLAPWVRWMVSYAVGVLLAAAFLHLLPEAFMQAESIEGLFAVTLAGVLAFFLLEKVALWRHHHHDAEAGVHAHHDQYAPHTHKRGGSPNRRVGSLIVIGDGFHNFVDGILIAAAFLTDVRLGITTTLAIIAHEIPQEVGDFMVLLHSGYSKAKALLLNVLSGLMAVLGGLVGYFALDNAHEATPYVLALAAASFIYIAVADLIPDMHRSTDGRSTLIQVVLIAAGIATIVLSHMMLHQH